MGALLFAVWRGIGTGRALHSLALSLLGSGMMLCSIKSTEMGIGINSLALRI